MLTVKDSLSTISEKIPAYPFFLAGSQNELSFIRIKTYIPPTQFPRSSLHVMPVTENPALIGDFSGKQRQP